VEESGSSDRWFQVEVADALVGRLADTFAANGCLVVRGAAGLLVALPGAPSDTAEASLRAFLAAWHYGTGAVLRPVRDQAP
jgi:hypothetical protein